MLNYLFDVPVNEQQKYIFLNKIVLSLFDLLPKRIMKVLFVYLQELFHLFVIANYKKLYYIQ